ncbi:uncharacterized protein EDB91DRAFT_1086768, partial [Suillus paluster]|uniref:uncharacterized protein n=1 Tax=Suillus paluster TaxID=48578 RepID=UPI001B8797F8
TVTPQLRAASSSEDSKIPKPASEPGRPGRGGYTLREALDWNPKAYDKIQVLQINSRIPRGLCIVSSTTTLTRQNALLPKVLRYWKSQLDNFPDLDNYNNLWPVNDLIMTRLKYTSGRARRKVGEMAVGKSKSKARNWHSKISSHEFYAHQGERNYIMQVVCEATQNPQDAHQGERNYIMQVICEATQKPVSISSSRCFRMFSQDHCGTVLRQYGFLYGTDLVWHISAVQLRNSLTDNWYEYSGVSQE